MFSLTESLADSFNRTQRIIEMQTDGLTHADSLLQPPFRGNCMNWVLGHILTSRNGVLQHLGMPPVLAEPEGTRYRKDSDPIKCAEEALPFEKLLGGLEKSHQAISEALAETSQETMATTIQTGGGETTVGEWVVFLHWHETYHVGQLELLRQLAGKNDAVI